jgi:hypothetical protein
MSNLNFEQWMQQVDKYISAKCGGMTSGDLADYCYADAYDDGASPAKAARAAIKAESEG